MADHRNDEQAEPVSFRDNRKIDPATGKARGAGGNVPESANSDLPDPDLATGAAAGSRGDADGTAAGNPDDPDAGAPELPADGDALAQAEAILNEVGPDATATETEAELRNDLLRLQAEYVNYRKRVERDRDVARDMAVIGVLNSLMPVLDDIDAARQHGDLAEGPFAAIAGKLESVLTNYGLERIDETGVEFDPNVHEALMQQPGADVTFDSVNQILRAGYRKGDRVLRAAQVIVAVPE